MDHLLHDLRTALRSLRKRPGFSSVVILTLALGIGANTAVFSVLDGVLLKPLPYPDSQELVRIYQLWEDGETGEAQYQFNYVTGLDYLDYRAQTEVFEGVAAFYSYREMGADLTGGDRPERIVRMPVSSEFFQVLGVLPARGRAFTLEEERGGVPLAVISHGLWQRHFAGALDVVGRSVELDGVVHEVIGVMPRGFQGPLGRPVEVWTPENLDPTDSRNTRSNHYLSVVARLAPGVTFHQAQDRMDVVTRTIAEEVTPEDGAWLAQLLPLQEDRVGESRATLWVLMAAVALVLLSTCVNVANLFLVRSFSRGRELAVRAALGSGRGGLARQLLTESLVLALLGGFLGLGLAWAGIQALVALAPEGLPRISEIGLNRTVLLFTLALSLLTGLVFGLAPTLRLSRPDLAGELREGDRGSTVGKGQHRLRSGLVVSEVAVALVLLVGAGILLRSFAAIQRVDLAIRSEGVLTYEVHLPDSRYPNGEDRIQFYEALFPRIRALPGVSAVGATSWLPVQGQYHDWGVSRMEGEEIIGNWHGSDMRMVAGDYFDVLDIDLLQGRLLGSEDRADTGPVCVINQFIQERDFPGEDPVGKLLWAAGEARTIVGVVENVPHDVFGAVSAQTYIHHNQFAGNRNWALIQAVSFQGDPADLVAAVREELRGVDPSLVLFRVRSMEDLLVDGVARQRFSMLLMGIFAGMALLLAAVGIYGVLSYLVSQRGHEIGIRMALGADPGNVRWLVVRQGMMLAGAGIGVGLVTAGYLSRFLRSLVFEARLADPLVFGGVAVGLGLTALLAAYLPARRATRVDPATAFRGD
ncbi:MAG: ABC transporter permease [Longimicrobiales bacterium]